MIGAFCLLFVFLFLVGGLSHNVYEIASPYVIPFIKGSGFHDNCL